MIDQPRYCDPRAFSLFGEQLPMLDTTDGLLRASLAISMHALDDVCPEEVQGYLTGLANRVLRRAKSNQVTAILAHLHDVLFHEEGFVGDQLTYYHPRNCLLPTVIGLRRGTPSTLGLIYKFVGVRTGLFVEGVNSPGHFLVRVRGYHNWLIVDPFASGRILSCDEAYNRVERFVGRKVPHTRDSLPTASHADWLLRILTNLTKILESSDRHEDAKAMQELRTLLLGYRNS